MGEYNVSLASGENNFVSNTRRERRDVLDLVAIIKDDKNVCTTVTTIYVYSAIAEDDDCIVQPREMLEVFPCSALKHFPLRKRSIQC